MKRPRRPAKKTARKAVRKKRQTKAQKAAQAEAKHRASLRKIDPYYLDPKLIPVGYSYQWKIEGARTPAGWTAVPFSRHAHDFPPEYQNLFRQIAFCGLALMETTAEQARAELAVSFDAAKKMNDAATASPNFGTHGRFRIMPDDWVETEKIPREAAQNEGPPVDVAVVLMVRVPVRWKSAALYLKLELNEYVRRRILMERPILGCIDQFSQETVYEPVNLQFTSVHKEA